MKILLGADPELFLRNRKTGYYVSAHGMFPGTKDAPHKVENGAVQVDGLALEFNINPASSEDEFNGNIESVLSQMEEMVKEVDPDLDMEFIPYATFEAKYFEELAAESKILGCTPDFNYTGAMTQGPEGLADRPFRTAAGHVHIGWADNASVDDHRHFEDCRFVSQQFFLNGVFGNPTHIEKTRLQYYGNNGAFRPKTYGVELREPSNLWVANEEGRRGMYRKVMQQMKEIAG